MAIAGTQLDLLQQRLCAVGVTRRGFLRLAATLGFLGSTGVTSPARAARPGAGEQLARDQVVRIGGGGYFSSDPVSHDFGSGSYGTGHPALFAGLMRFNADFVAMPHLASKLESSANGAIWTFTLRKDAKWSNGAPCTAHDFVWTWGRQLEPATGAPNAALLYDVKNAEPFNKGQITDAAQLGLQARDDHTLTVTLEGPREYFPILTAFRTTLPSYRPAVEKHGSKWTEPGNIVSNGPFVLESWDHHRQFVLRRNPLYWDVQAITLERAIVRIIPVAAGLLPYENDEVDISLVPSGDVVRAQADARLSKEVFRFPRPQTWYLVPQVTRPPFDSLAVRSAVSRAIDRGAVTKVAQGSAIPAHSMIPPGILGHIEDRKIQEIQRFDPRVAMAMLKGTPFEGGRNWPRVVLSVRTYGFGVKPMAEAIQAMLLEHLNMRSELEVLETRTYFDRLWKQSLQLSFASWGMDYPDPHNGYFEPFYSKRPTGRRQAWQNHEFDRLLETARGERDRTKRLEQYRRAEEVLQTDVGYVPVAWITPYAAVKPWVRGVPRNRSGEFVVDANIYSDMLSHLYVLEDPRRRGR